MGASHASKGGRRRRYYVSRAALSGRRKEAGSVFRIPAPEIENRVANAVGAHLAARANAIDGCHIDRGDGRGDYAQHESGPTRRQLPSEDDVRNAIDCATVSATRIEILLNESIVSEGQDRVLTLPWMISRRRREIIQGVGEAQRPLRAMRTKARNGFVRALGDTRGWLDELLIDPAQTIESLAIREDKSERSIRMTVSLAFISPVLAEAALEGRLPRGFSVKRLTDLPMLWSSSGAARADSGSSRTWLIHAVFDRLLTLCWGARRFGPTASIVQPGKRNFAGRDWPAILGADHGRMAGIRFADALQLANLSELRRFLSRRKPCRFAGTGWWAMQGSNLRPLPCEGSALPLS